MPMKSAVVTLGPSHDKPWWWKHLALDEGSVGWTTFDSFTGIDFHRTSPRSEIPMVMLRVLRHLLRWRKQYSHVFTVELDLVGLSIAFWQTVTGMRRPRHVIIQFIMRERQTDRSVESQVRPDALRVSVRSPCRRFLDFGSGILPKSIRVATSKTGFVPVLTNPELLEQDAGDGRGLLSLPPDVPFATTTRYCGRLPEPTSSVLIVGGGGAHRQYAGLENVQVMENIPVAELESLMLRSRAVVVPLQDRAISVGQSVVLQAMALGKAVVATRTAGTIDYIDHMSDGILVPPGDEQELRDALLLLESAELRRSWGRGRDHASRRCICRSIMRSRFAKRLLRRVDLSSPCSCPCLKRDPDVRHSEKAG